MQRKGMRKLMFKVSFEDKRLYINTNIRRYIRSMPCYFVSNGLEMQMPSETFDLLWNSLLNAKLTDSETSSSFGEGDKLLDKPESTGWRKQDDGYYNNKSNNSNYSKGITSKRRNSTVYATYAVLQ